MDKDVGKEFGNQQISMVIYMKESIRKIKNMDSAYIDGQMDQYMRVHSKTI